MTAITTSTKNASRRSYPEEDLTTQSGAAQTLAAVCEYDAFGHVTSEIGAWAGPFEYAGNVGYQSLSIPGTSTPDEGLKLLGHRSRGGGDQGIRLMIPRGYGS